MHVFYVLIAKLNNFIESFLFDFSLRDKSVILPLHHRVAYRSLARAIALQTFLQGNVKQKCHAGNVILSGQFEILPAMYGANRSGVNHA